MTEAADPLSFVLFGVPRSGTSALADALNLQRDVFCGHERLLGYRKWASRQEIIDALLLAGSNNPGAAIKKNLGHLSRKIEESQNFLIGDKFPEYYVRLKEVINLHASVKKICIYRSPYGFAASWDVRANNIHDSTWDRGRIGIFGIFDMLIMFHILPALAPDTTVVSYAALFQDGVRIFPALVEQITGQPADPEVIPAFRKQYFQRRKEDPERAETSPYRELLQSIDADGIDAAIRERRMMTAQRLKAVTRGFVENAAPRVSASIAARLADLPGDASIEVVRPSLGQDTLGRAPTEWPRCASAACIARGDPGGHPFCARRFGSRRRRATTGRNASAQASKPQPGLIEVMHEGISC